MIQTPYLKGVGYCQHKNINKLNNSSEINKANALWALGDY
jgi:hypothetical protein